MIFTEFRFLGFFLLVFGVHWLLRRQTHRKLWLLLASYAFYAGWDWRFLSLIWISTAVDYVAGLRIHDSQDPKAKRRWLQLSLFANLGMLGFFKYCNFFIESAASLLQVLGFEPHLSTLGIVLPVGISFFTFQTMSYSLDIYRGQLKPTRSALDMALFVGFFPQLVAGPIVRALDFLPQLKVTSRLSSVEFKAALALFLSGYIKKACLSDNIAPMVDAYFAEPEAWSAMAAWIAMPAYGVQVYCDFSGYSDMAIACAAMLGYRLCLNFDGPYLATTLSGTWRRWHISLSTWLRDYLYFPLGGSRGGKAMALRNLFLVMFLGGLWHGAAWNFVGWGILHGIGLVIQTVWSQGPGRRWADRRWLDPLRILLTSWYFLFALCIFRGQDLADGWTVAKAFSLLGADGTRTQPLYWLLLIPIGYLLHWAGYRLRRTRLLDAIPTPVFAFGFGALFALAFAFMRVDHPPFMYFQF